MEFSEPRLLSAFLLPEEKPRIWTTVLKRCWGSRHLSFYLFLKLWKLRQKTALLQTVNEQIIYIFNMLKKYLKRVWNSHSPQKFFVNVVLFINSEVLNPVGTWRAQLTWAHSTWVHTHTQICRHWLFPLLGNKMHPEDSKYIPLVCQSSYISASFL